MSRTLTRRGVVSSSETLGIGIRVLGIRPGFAREAACGARVSSRLRQQVPWPRSDSVCGDVVVAEPMGEGVDSRQGATERCELEALFRSHALDLRRMLGGMRFRAERHSSAYPWHSLEDLDDLVQETFLHALRSSSHLPLSSAKVPYLFAIARNLYIDRLRRRRQVSVEFDPQSVEHALVSVEERERELQECVERLARYAETLQPSMHLFYEMRFVRGLSQRDTARELSASRRHVRTLERRLLSGAARALRGISARDT